ncbi:MAG: hypothetical protein JOZ58_18300 [Acetobacteraceae bacterium]|nr:hypothetical protein [Acetobacteraceae bacterium]
MAFNLLPAPANGLRLQPVGLSVAPMFCFALLVTSCALASFAFACATPFAAFAVIAAAMLPLRRALLVVAGAWLINQGIGFSVHHYPVDAKTMLWGATIGMAALVATAASAAVLRAMPRSATPLVLVAAWICAYAAYELTLFAATPFLGGAGAFTAAIVARLGMISASWLIGLVAVCEIVRLLNPFDRRHFIS